MEQQYSIPEYSAPISQYTLVNTLERSCARITGLCSQLMGFSVVIAIVWLIVLLS